MYILKECAEAFKKLLQVSLIIITLFLNTIHEKYLFFDSSGLSSQHIILRK